MIQPRAVDVVLGGDARLFCGRRKAAKKPVPSVKPRDAKRHDALPNLAAQVCPDVAPRRRTCATASGRRGVQPAAEVPALLTKQRRWAVRFSTACCTALLLFAQVAPAALAASAKNWWLAGSAEQNAFNEDFADLFASPADPETLGRFASAATRIGNFEAAIGTLERILLLRPRLTPVRLELGVLYYRIGAYETALFHLRKALGGGGLAPVARARGEAFLDAAEGKLSRHAVGGVVSFGLRYQTNANAATSESVVRLGGNDFTATADEEGDFNLFLSGRLRHGYDLGTQYDESWESEVAAHATKQFDVEDADLAFAEVRSGPVLSVLPDSLDFLTLQPFLLAGLTAIDRDFNNHWGGGGAEVKKRFGSLAVAKARYSARYRDFDRADERDGLLQTLDLLAGLVVTEDIVLNAGVALTDEAADRDFRSNWRLGLKAGVTARYDAP